MLQLTFRSPLKQKRTLGIEASTSSSGKIHLQLIKERGLDWTDKLRSNRYIRPREGWLSYEIQLKPKVEWSIQCLIAVPKEIDEVNHSSRPPECKPKHWEGLALATSTVSRCIAMFNLNIDRMGACVHYLRQHWGMDAAPEALLLQA